MAIATTNKTGANINMTPLIDVLLVLLIIFMVITPLMPQGLPAELPKPASKHLPNSGDANPIVIRVEKDGRLSINRQPITVEELGSRLAKIYQTRAGRAAFVEGDGSLEFHEIARVIDIARGAGADRIALMTLVDVPS